MLRSAWKKIAKKKGGGGNVGHDPMYLWTYLITCITACPVGLAVVPVIMSVGTFKTDDILYILYLRLFNITFQL